MIVMKFGGSSVANREQIEKVMGIVKSRLSRCPVVVSSAHKGMTDALINSANAAVHQDFYLPDVIDLQSDIVSSLGCPANLLSDMFQEISDILRGISLVRELSPRSLDYIASFGERMAVRCIADFFARQGLKSKAYDVWDLGFITDLNFGNAQPVADYAHRMKKAFAELVPHNVVPIVTGFVGKSESGEITTVGRNGSDLTATLIGAALGAEEVEIWTDTDGVLSADPSVVKNARSIPLMRFDEAAELAYFGNQVLHPSTLLPAVEKGIPVRVLNTNHPDHPGTVIDQEGDPQTKTATSVAYKENQAVLTITATQMLQTAGFLAKVFDLLARYGVVVDVISTSEISVSLTTDKTEHLMKALPELERLGHCQVHTGKTVLVVVGRNLAQHRSLAVDILQSGENVGAKVDMLSLGLGSINFSMVLDDKDIAKVVPALHQTLFERCRR
jgi:aspartate kinase